MNEANEILIDRYINGEMNSEEINNFNNRLASDAEFATTYKSTLAAHKLIEEAGRMDLKKTLESFDKPEPRNTLIPLWVKRSLPIAAALAVFTAVYMFGFFNTSMTSEEVYDNYFVAYTPPSALRDSGSSENVNWNEAVRQYSLGNYEETLRLLDISESNVHYTTIEFYQGMSYLLLDYPDYNDAAYYLNQVREDDSDYREQANWYYGLTILKQGRQNDAEEVFKTIVKDRTYNHRKAQDILETKIEN